MDSDDVLVYLHLLIKNILFNNKKNLFTSYSLFATFVLHSIVNAVYLNVYLQVSYKKIKIEIIQKKKCKKCKIKNKMSLVRRSRLHLICFKGDTN